MLNRLKQMLFFCLFRSDGKPRCGGIGLADFCREDSRQTASHEGENVQTASQGNTARPFSSPSKPLARTSPYVLAISSGKGGVGKTNVVINLAVEIQRRGLRVLVFDADLGLSNVPILLGLVPQYNIAHVLFGEMRMKEVLFPGPEGVTVLPAGFGVQELASLTEEQKLRLLCETEELEQDFDVVLIDTGAGISPNVLFFNIVSHDNIIVVCPEPASMSDAYVLMKILALRYQRKTFKVLMNSVKEEKEAVRVLDRITEACQRFLGVSVSHFGNIPYDRCIREAVRYQKPVVEMYPDATSSQSFSQLASDLLGSVPEDFPVGSLQFFWKRLFASENSEWDPDPCRPRPTLVRT
jgi:flagellar biosynthesis protein FlhG